MLSGAALDQVVDGGGGGCQTVPYGPPGSELMFDQVGRREAVDGGVGEVDLAPGCFGNASGDDRRVVLRIVGGSGPDGVRVPEREIPDPFSAQRRRERSRHRSSCALGG